MTAKLEKLIKGLSPRPRLALLAWRPGQEAQWQQVVAWAALPGDTRVMSFRSTLTPLLDRGLAEIAVESSFDHQTQSFVPARYRLTARGITARALLDQAGEGEK